MTIAAINPTIPASPKLCTNPIILLAISPTNGTFPPSKLTAMPKASSDITTFVRLSNIEVNPAIAFMFPPLFINNYQNESFHFDLYTFTTRRHFKPYKRGNKTHNEHYFK